MSRVARRLLQSLGLPLMAYLFICLMTAQIRQASFSLPSLGEPDSNSALELLLLSLPGQLLFVLAGCFTHRRRLLLGVFLLAASITALLQCLVFAQCFGTTWSTAETFILLASNAPALLLALLPGLALLYNTETTQPSSTIS
ncbi:hypothetical protein [Pseudomonas sp. 1121_17]|uniref:hypothetical protein n=1 Tax=Pseudomonas sp. 1121_17 TaxID=2604458 RepID=UPI0040641413